MAAPEILTADQCLQNHQFQDWMAERRLMHRVPVNSEELELKPTKEQKSAHIKERYLNILKDNQGYLVPLRVICSHIYGTVNAKRLQNIVRWGDNVKHLLENPSVLFQAPKLGKAVGVDDFRLTPATVPLTYCLWENCWSDVPINNLALKCYGVDDVATRARVVSAVQRTLVKEQLLGSKVRIVHKGSLFETTSIEEGRISFQMQEIEEEEEIIEPEDYQHLHLRFDYQNWLASPDLELLIRNQEIPIVKAGETFRGDQSALLSSLEKYHGLILDYDFLTALLSSDSPKPVRFDARLHRIREKLENPDSIYVAKELGVGLGIEELKVSKANMIVLYGLWRRMAQDVPMSGLEKRSFESDDDSADEKLKSAIYFLRRLLRDSNYEIVTHRGGPVIGQGSYLLRRKAENSS